MADKKPNILVLWGDDISYWNISHYSKGMTGYQTPHIDRLAREGATFTDWYGQQNNTAGRAAFITGQNPIRTGLSRAARPGANVGLQAEDPTIAELLKPLGYATGQFGTNQLGDRDEFLPTRHGFDEFFGSLRHLNAEGEPARSDEEITWAALAFMEKQANADKPFFLWYNPTAMCGTSGRDDDSTRIVTHDDQIGRMLETLDRLGIADNTIVMYSTDNGPENDTWTDGGAPRRGRDDTNWEGAWRVPAFIRWPGRIRAGIVFNGICCHQDMLPTLLSAAGDRHVTQKLLTGYTVGDKTFTVHIDGVNLGPYLTGAVKESPRKTFFYMSDAGDMIAVRAGDYKLTFAEQRARTMKVWHEPFVDLRMPHVYDLRRDPFARAEYDSNTYVEWVVSHVPELYQVQGLVAQQIDNFVKYPPRLTPARFNLDEVLRQVQAHT